VDDAVDRHGAPADVRDVLRHPSGGIALGSAAAIVVVGAVLVGLWRYQDWGRLGAQLVGVLLLLFLAFAFFRAPTTYKALDWYFSPFNLLVTFAAAYCITKGFSAEVKAVCSVAAPADPGGRTTFVLKRGVLLFIGYAMWITACRAAHRIATKRSPSRKSFPRSRRGRSREPARRTYRSLSGIAAAFETIF